MIKPVLILSSPLINTDFSTLLWARAMLNVVWSDANIYLICLVLRNVHSGCEILSTWNNLFLLFLSCLLWKDYKARLYATKLSKLFPIRYQLRSISIETGILSDVEITKSDWLSKIHLISSTLWWKPGRR